MEEKAAVYCRLSQDDGSVGESGSIQTQRTLLTQYCKEQHISIADYYTGITELTPYILNELIERIVVHEKAVGPDGVKTQQVDIYYKFVGCINQRRNGGCTGEVIKADEAQPESRPA